MRNLTSGNDTAIEIIVPFPPSLNTYWRNVKARTLISAAGRKYRKELQQLAKVSRWKGFGSQRVHVHILAYPPDRRRRDLDNLPKSVLDGLTACNIWDDDSQIDDLRITRCEVVKDGELRIRIVMIGA